MVQYKPFGIWVLTLDASYVITIAVPQALFYNHLHPDNYNKTIHYVGISILREFQNPF